MRKLLHYLFPIAALFIALVGPSRADAPNLAVCRDHVCVMSETDYMSLQAFAKRLRDYAENAGQVDGERELMIRRYRERADSCESWRDGHKSSWKR